MTKLANRKVLVVGGSSGIGLGVARAALAEGARVAIAGRSEDKLRTALRDLGAGERASIQVVDMTNEADVARMFAQIGAIDHLVSTAGTLPPGDPIGQTDLGSVRSFVDNKLIGAVILAKHAAPRLAPGGSMTFTSGINKDRPPVPGGAVVAGIAGSFSYFARALALELAPVRVNVVSPGWVDTPMWDVAGDAKPAYFADLASRLPSRRVPSAEEVAAAYIYLMASGFTTGETLRIDGGQNLI